MAAWRCMGVVPSGVSRVCVVVVGTNIGAFVNWHQWRIDKFWESLNGFWKAELLISWWVCYFWIKVWKADLLVNWSLNEDLRCFPSVWSNWESVKRVLELSNLSFRFEWIFGFDMGWLKNLYLCDVTPVLGELKVIRKIFQRSTTFMLKISSNSEVF